MRLAAPLLILLAAVIAWPQPQAEPSSLFLTMRPDVWMTVREHAMSTEDVTVTVSIENYPPELLQLQIGNLGTYLGTPTRILYVRPGGSGYTHASFAATGIIDRAKGLYRLQPIVRAFAGAPEPFRINGIHVTLEGELGNRNDLAELSTDALRLEVMRTNRALPMLEYRIQLLTQDPDKLAIPEKVQAPVRRVVKQTRQGLSPVYYLLLALGALAAGALVYSALLRASARKP